MSNDLYAMVQPVLGAILTFVLGYIGAQLKKVIPYVIEYLIKKVGLTNYEKTKKEAWDIWHIIEEDGRLGQLANSKIDTFALKLKAKYPQITDERINELRQAIAGEYNKDKESITKSVNDLASTIVIEPKINYVTPDGKPLQIVDATIKNVPTPGEASDSPNTLQ